MQKYKLVTLSEALFRKTQAAWEKEWLLIVLTNVSTNEGGYRTHILPPLRVMNARREYCYNRNNVIIWQDFQKTVTCRTWHIEPWTPLFGKSVLIKYSGMQKHASWINLRLVVLTIAVLTLNTDNCSFTANQLGDVND